MADDLLKRLDAWLDPRDITLRSEAAALIRALESENAALRRIVLSLDCECDSYHGVTCSRCAAIAQKEPDNGS